jgi:uncharacterized protein YqhQ
MAEKINVGGQAVLEGVMMRSPRSFAVAVRRPNGDIVIREERWISIWDRLKFLKKPFLRGAIVMFEALYNGLSALSFSANEAAREEKEGEMEADALSPLALTFTIIFSLAFGLLLFVGLPHALTWGVGRAAGTNLDVDSFAFHLIDGAIKLAIFIAYIWLISLLKEVRRVFQYHGAEHKSIFTYENGEELTVQNARKYTTYHPRCGTSFLIMVLLISIFIFAVVFPYVPKFSESVFVNQALNVLMKIFLMFPIAGLSYEFTKLSGKHPHNPVVKIFIQPGLWMQRLTTIEPDDDQLEVALVALKTSLWRETQEDKKGEPLTLPFQTVKNIDELDLRLAA